GHARRARAWRADGSHRRPCSDPTERRRRRRLTVHRILSASMASAIAGQPALLDPVEDVPVRGVPDRSELVGLLRIARERRVVRQAELLVAIALPLVALGQDLLALLARVPHGALHACRRPSPARVLSRQPRSGQKRAVRVAKRPRLAPEQRVVPVTHHGSRRTRAGSPALAPLAGRAELVEPGLTI